MQPGFVMVDHVSAAVEQHISGGAGKYDDIRQYTAKFTINAANRVAIPFDVPVWLMHQTRTDAQGRKPGYIPHHCDAAEARNFAENAHFAFNLGTTDLSNKCVISCTKARRRPPVSYEIIQINGAYGRVSDTEVKYQVDATGAGFIETASMKKVHKPTEEEAEYPEPTEILDPRMEL
jgi:hypothetical protein